MKSKALAVPYVAWMALFVVAPLILVVVYAFTTRDGGFTTANFSTLTQYAGVFGRSFLLAGIVCFVYVVLVKKQRLLPQAEVPKYTGAIFETAGQFAYIYAIADQEHVALAAPIISAYCAASVLWSRIILKEKLSWKHYGMILLVVIGIVIMGVFDV